MVYGMRPRDSDLASSKNIPGFYIRNMGLDYYWKKSVIALVISE
jgi:hypothetical protein